MRRVDRPNFSPDETFEACISRIRDHNLKQRLEYVSERISDEAEAYFQRAVDAELHLVQRTNGVAGLVTTGEMVALYDQRLAGKKGAARHIYDAIKLLPGYGICPFCDHRPVSTLDHILPKSPYPALAVTPLNLVGACADCNKLKLAAAPCAADEVVLHPYFDNVEEGRWLAAEIVQGRVAAVLFKSQPVGEWSDILNERVRLQFEMLGLASLYGAQAAREISALTLVFDGIHRGLGADGVRQELVRQARSREAINLNSWQAVAFGALSESDWFCDGGFRG